MKEYEYKIELISVEESLVEMLNKEGRLGWRVILYGKKIKEYPVDVKNTEWVIEILFERERAQEEFITCPVCKKEYHQWGYKTHKAMHRRREELKKHKP